MEKQLSPNPFQVFRSETYHIFVEALLKIRCSMYAPFLSSPAASSSPSFCSFLRSRHTINLSCLSEETLGFQLLDPCPHLGPLSNSRPTIITCPNSPHLKPRSVISFTLPKPVYMLHRFSVSCGRRLHLRCESILLSWPWLCQSKILLPFSSLAMLCDSLTLLTFYRRCDCGSRTSLPRSSSYKFMPSSSRLVTFTSVLAGRGFHASRIMVSLGWFDGYLCRGQFKKLRKNGIMIPSPWRGDYRSFLNLLPLSPLITEFIQVQIIKLREMFHTLKSLKNNGIMTTTPRSVGYRNLFKQTPPEYKTATTLLLADEQFNPTILVPARISAMEPFSTSLSLLTVTIPSSNALFVDECSTNRVITCANLLSSFGLQALMDHSSNHFSYLGVALAFNLLCCFYFVLSFIMFALMVGICSYGLYEPCFV